MENAISSLGNICFLFSIVSKVRSKMNDSRGDII